MNVIKPGREKARFRLEWLLKISDLVALSAPFWQITKIKGAAVEEDGDSDAVLAIVHFRENFGCNALIAVC